MIYYRALTRLRMLNRSLAAPGTLQLSRQFASIWDRRPTSDKTTTNSHDGATVDNNLGGNGEKDSDELFSAENIKELSNTEVSRLRLTYGLIRDHAQAAARGVEEVDPTTNPLLDPRSFQIRLLPRIPDEVLTHFRRELPADEANETRPVVTREVWDSIASGTPHDLLTEASVSASQWDAVDARTMSRSSLTRRARTQSYKHSNNVEKGSPSPEGAMLTMGTTPMRAKKKKKKPIVLRDVAGRINVDFRSVATLKMFLSETGKILPRRKSQLSAKSQRKLAKAVKIARRYALIDPAPKPPSVTEIIAMDEALEAQQAQ